MARVLVVDEAPDVLMLARLCLQRAGHHVLLAADGEHAVAHLADETVDLVVVDPWMTASDARRMLDAARACRVLVISGHAPAGDAAHLAKPFTAEALVAAAAAALGPVILED